MKINVRDLLPVHFSLENRHLLSTVSLVAEFDESSVHYYKITTDDNCVSDCLLKTEITESELIANFEILSQSILAANTVVEVPQEADVIADEVMVDEAVVASEITEEVTVDLNEVIENEAVPADVELPADDVVNTEVGVVADEVTVDEAVVASETTEEVAVDLSEIIENEAVPADAEESSFQGSDSDDNSIILGEPYPVSTGVDLDGNGEDDVIWVTKLEEGMYEVSNFNVVFDGYRYIGYAYFVYAGDKSDETLNQDVELEEAVMV